MDDFLDAHAGALPTALGARVKGFYAHVAAKQHNNQDDMRIMQGGCRATGDTCRAPVRCGLPGLPAFLRSAVFCQQAQPVCSALLAAPRFPLVSLLTFRVHCHRHSLQACPRSSVARWWAASGAASCGSCRCCPAAGRWPPG